MKNEIWKKIRERERRERLILKKVFAFEIISFFEFEYIVPTLT